MQCCGSVLPESAHTFDRIHGEPEVAQGYVKGEARKRAGRPGRRVRCPGRRAAEVSGPDAGLDEDEPMNLGDASKPRRSQARSCPFGACSGKAHIVVQLVMIGLAGASIYSWAIIIDKTMTFRRLNRANGPVRGSFLVRPVAGGSLSLAA